MQRKKEFYAIKQSRTDKTWKTQIWIEVSIIIPGNVNIGGEEFKSSKITWTDKSTEESMKN